MLLIATNEVHNLDGYIEYFVPIAAQTIREANGQYLMAGEANSMSGHPMTRIVIVRFENSERLQEWWQSENRQKAWKIGEQYALFRDIAILADVPLVRLPLFATDIARKKKIHQLTRVETDSFFLSENDIPPKRVSRLEKYGLSKRELEVLAWVAKGKSNIEVASILNIKLGTIKKHLEHIFEKLGVESRVAAILTMIE